MSVRIERETRELQHQYKALLAEHTEQAIELARAKIPELIYFTGVIGLSLEEIADIVNLNHPYPDTPPQQARLVQAWAKRLEAVARETPRHAYPVTVVRKYPKEYTLYSDAQIQRFSALARLETLRENVAVLSGARLATLKYWASYHGINLKVAITKAREQRLPAFRQGRTWLILADYQPK